MGNMLSLCLARPSLSSPWKIESATITLSQDLGGLNESNVEINRLRGTLKIEKKNDGKVRKT